MATITIRDLVERVMRALQVRASLLGRSVEAEARAILSELVNDRLQKPVHREGLGTAIQRLFAPLGGVELKIPPRRKSSRPIPSFE